MAKRVLVTAGLPYSNGRLHVGHVAGCYLPADIYVRYLRMKGQDVRYVCGSDDHGVAILLTAEKEGKTPAEVASHYHDLQKKDFDGLGIEFDVFGATSQTSFHAKKSQEFFQKIYDRGFFEKRATQQFYDPSKSVFLPDRYVKGTCGHCGQAEQNGDQCENCGKLLDHSSLKDATSVLSGQPAELRQTVHWFLDLSQCQKNVEEWLEKAEVRDHTRNYVRSLIADGFVTRSMTRDISWGIPVPIDDPDAKGKVLYVWFDAPIGYISNTMQMCEAEGKDPESYTDWWKSPDTDIVHFIGEDNTIFHCVIWIAMLAAEETYQLPKSVAVNQFLNIQFPDREVEKISKSRGTAVWIGDYLADDGDPDILRYYLTAIAPEKSRTVYLPEDLIQRNNTDLANVLGNFVNRLLSFTRKYVGEEIPGYEVEKCDDVDRAFLSQMKQAHQSVSQHLDKRTTKQALLELMDFCREGNKYLDDRKPWTTRKTDMDRTTQTLAIGIHTIRFMAITLRPFMPNKSQTIAKMLGFDVENVTWDQALDAPLSGQKLGETEILFQKIEDAE